MKDNKLIASVVVFKELLDQEKDIYDIIAEFIKAALDFKDIWVFTSTEMTEYLEEIFDFTIPEAVIKTSLRKKMVAQNILDYDNGKYSRNKDFGILNSHLKAQHTEKEKLYNEIQKRFIDHFKKNISKSDGDIDESMLQNELSYYLLGTPNGNSRYLKEISAYIIQNKNDLDFMEKLNVIREGLVLYTGIRYTSDLNELGSWKNDLTIYLDTDILFNATRLNGDLYYEIFNDFYKLVKEINANSKRKSGSKKIKLKYFEETEKEIHNFFHVASLIVERKKSLNPSKIAMSEIVNGCSTKSDVIVKRNKFFLDLKSMNIDLEESKNYYQNNKYIVEGHSVLEELEQISINAKREFDEEKCKDYLQQFTKINYLRRGKNNLGFNKCGSVIITGNRFAHHISNSKEIRENEGDIPFATDIDFVTDKFWFKLKKGFGGHDSRPKSFAIVTKAQIVLSSQISSTVHEKYTAINDKYKSGELSKEEVISLNYELRESALKPEDIVEENVQNSIDFVNNYTIENHLREQTLLKKKAAEGEQAKKALRKIEQKEFTNKIKTKKKKLKRYYYGAFISFILVVLGIFFIGYLCINYLKEPGDSTLTIIGFVFGLITVFPIIRFFKFLDRRIRKHLRTKLKEIISNQSQNIYSV
jgi:hypothetical protein